MSKQALFPVDDYAVSKPVPRPKKWYFCSSGGRLLLAWFKQEI